MNSLQSAGEGRVDLSRGPSLSGDPPGLRLGLDDGVRGSLYRELRTEKDTCILDSFYFLSSVGMKQGVISTLKLNPNLMINLCI